MSIWNKVLVGLIAVLAIGFFYMAARTLKVERYWAELALKHQRELAKVRAENRELAEGVPGKKDEQEPTLGIKQIRQQLHTLLLDRGRVWRGCTGKVTNPQEVVVAVRTGDQPQPHGIADKTRLFVFEDAEGEKGGHYLGEFIVAGVDEANKAVGLKPARKMSPREVERLTQSKGTWTLCEKMPADDHEAFAGLKTEELKALVPEAVFPEYMQDGKPAQKTDPDARVQGGKYVRRLRDYEFLLANLSAQRTLYIDLIEATRRDKQYMEEALADAKRQEEFCQKTIAQLKKDLGIATRERDEATKYRKAFEQEVAKTRQAVDQLIAANRSAVDDLSRAQQEGSRRIDERSGSMAGQVGMGSVN